MATEHFGRTLAVSLDYAGGNTMRKLTAAVLVLIAISFLWGCYESEVPLSKKPSSKVDAKLIGNWRSVPRNDNDRTISLLLKQFNENEYLVAWKEGKDGKTLMARGFNTKIVDIHIINLQNIESLDKNERTYVFFKYGFNAKGNLVVNVLSDDFAKLKRMKFKSARDFYDFVQENISENGLFGESIEFCPTAPVRLEINP